MINNESFTPFFGFVEDVQDPEKMGRIRVRVVGYHSQNDQELKTNDLKWFYPVIPNSASLNGVGESPTGYLINSTVFGYFIDYDLQDGIIIGSINGINDVSDLAKNTNIDNTIVSKKNSNRLNKEPESPYNATYPNNTVIQTKSGHVIEIDDTEDNERIHVYHSSGSYIEMHPNGDTVSKSAGKRYDIIGSDNQVYIDGNCDIDVNGDVYLDSNSTTIKSPINKIIGKLEVTESILSPDINATDTLRVQDITVEDHIHSGVTTGSGSTQGPE